MGQRGIMVPLNPQLVEMKLLDPCNMNVVEYTNGLSGSGCVNGRHTTITFICSPTSTPYGQVGCGERGQSDGICLYYLNIYTSAACGNGTMESVENGLSVGSITLIALLSFAVLYCFIGYVINGHRSSDYKNMKGNVPP